MPSKHVRFKIGNLDMNFLVDLVKTAWYAHAMKRNLS
jgi:hypothetical protein